MLLWTRIHCTHFRVLHNLLECAGTSWLSYQTDEMVAFIGTDNKMNELVNIVEGKLLC